MPPSPAYHSRLGSQRYPHAIARAVGIIHMPPPGCSVSRSISCIHGSPNIIVLANPLLIMTVKQATACACACAGCGLSHNGR